jgi:endonuclease/exonuclease/phosphatase family metal-dependent hydrolase
MTGGVQGPTVRLRVGTYNIHRCRGMDGRTDPARTAAMIADLRVDLIALQEVIGTGHTSVGHAERLADAVGLHWAMAPTRRLRGHLFGNVILSRFPIAAHTQYDLVSSRREPRCCQRTDLLVGDHVLHVYNVHLGTGLLERRRQAVQLARILDDPEVGVPKVVLGDFNEWVRGPATRVLTERLESIDLAAYLRRRVTYPGFLPLLHLDHIYYKGRLEVHGLELRRTPRALVTSDHLPLVAELDITFDGAVRRAAPVICDALESG